MTTDEDQDIQSDNDSPVRGEKKSRERPKDEGASPPRKVTFDDFQIQKTAQQQQIDDEKRAMIEREKRLEEQRPGFLKFAVPRLRTLGENMIGGTMKLFAGNRPHNEDESDDRAAIRQAQSIYEEERLHVRVARTNEDVQLGEQAGQTRQRTQKAGQGTLKAAQSNQKPVKAPAAKSDLSTETKATQDAKVPKKVTQKLEELIKAEEEKLLDEALIAEAYEEELQKEFIEEEPIGTAATPDEEEDETKVLTEQVKQVFIVAEKNIEKLSTDVFEELPPDEFEAPHEQIKDEPQIDAALNVYLDQLRDFDSQPRRASEPRDPRTDFVQLLSEQLDILREQLGAMSALFFWVNSKKQQLVLESGSLEDRAHMFLSSEKRFPIELDALSMVVTRKKPELHSSISPLAELDLIPYYSEAIGVRSFAAMPVLFGDGLVAVITVDSPDDDQFSQETLRILTSHSKLISGLIKSYIEKYDLLAAARTLESARKLYQIVSPEASVRALRDVRKGPEWVLRALTEAIAEIIDWEWLATASFDEARRIWSITSLQSKQSRSYIPPQTQIELADSIVGKCLQSGRSIRYDHLTTQQMRYSFDEDRSSAVGHSFLTIPIRTASKNYGALAIEHSERSRYTDADVETLEHLARSAASALEITALSEIVEERALTDLLTGVLNKRGFLQRINEELARAMEFDEPLTLVLFEIDSAAEFFSRFTQEDADTIVLAVTRLLRYGARPFDVVARVGEHAFAAILIKMPDEEGYLWSEKMRKMIVSEVIAIGKRSFSVTVSAGVSGARRDATIEELIEGAELAVERAKELGGNNVIVY